jgi:hypothetical protein
VSGQKVHAIDRDHIIPALVYEDGFSITAVAKEYGVTRQYISLILNTQYPDHRQRLMEARRAKRQQREAEQREADFVKMVRAGIRCSVCNALVPKKIRSTSQHGHVTCGPQCAKAWIALRYHLCEQCRQIHLKRCEATWKKNPKKYAKQLAWLGNPNRGHYEHCVQRGSRAYQYMVQYRPDLLDSIPLSNEIDRPQWRENNGS